MRRLKVLFLLVAALPLCGFKFLSGVENEKANKLYKKGQIGKAKSAYAKALKSDPTSPEVAYNFGNALFREGLFKESQSNYQRSIAQKSEDTLFKAKVFYNLGNSQYRQKDLSNAADSYKRSLRLNPKDEDAKYNLELVLKQMEKEKKDPEKDQKKDEKQQPKDPKQDQKEDQKQDQGEGQDKGEGTGGGAGSEGEKDQKPTGGSEPQEEKDSQQGQDKQQSEEGKDKEAAEKKEQEKADQPKSDAQLRAEQLLGALENQEQQVLKLKNSQNGPRSRVRRVAEQDW